MKLVDINPNDPVQGYTSADRLGLDCIPEMEQE